MCPSLHVVCRDQLLGGGGGGGGWGRFDAYNVGTVVPILAYYTYSSSSPRSQ